MCRWCLHVCFSLLLSFVSARVAAAPSDTIYIGASPSLVLSSLSSPTQISQALASPSVSSETGSFSHYVAFSSPAEPGQPRPLRQNPAAVVFETFAGIVALVVIVLISRCVYSIYRTPRVDRLALLRSRHRLDQEMAELQREQLYHRVEAMFPRRPPPPQYDASPAYEDAVRVVPREHAKEDRVVGYASRADEAV